MKIIEDKYIKLDVLDKQKYIKIIKDRFERELAGALDLVRVSAPLLVTEKSGLQDYLSGVERKVEFDILKDGTTLQIVQSLAKWKRIALKKYKIAMHKGLYTDMQAIRRDDKIDETHSIYVDQWDWEKVISKEDRTIEYLKQTVCSIVKAIKRTSEYLRRKSGLNFPRIKEKICFITSQELLDMFPDKTDKEREYEIVKKNKTVFIIGIGEKLSNGKPHDLRAPDYDDWTLNGDLMFYDEVLDIALEISSMGIRVDSKKLSEQLEKDGKQDRMKYDYHKQIIAGELPLTIGGGIGQSRLCMLLLERAHIGEVQSSYWDEKTIKECEQQKIELL